jgi:ketosteroid isomerase-like protein
MSQENVELVRKIFRSWAEGDLRDGVAAYDPHVVFVVRPPLAEPAVLLGPEQIRDYMAEFLRQWERYVVEAKALRPTGDTVLSPRCGARGEV